MTLCIAAACKDGRIVALTDTRMETDYSGSDAGFKWDFVASGWIALLSGNLSKATQAVATIRSVVIDAQFTRSNVRDKFSEASSAHYEKLCRELIALSLGMPWEQFLTKGKKEIEPETRRRAWKKIEGLHFDCDLIIFGFVEGAPHILSVYRDGTVDIEQNFAAIGSGATTAESVLDQRNQNMKVTPIEVTVYHVYEAYALALRAKIHGVGGPPQLQIIKSLGNGKVERRPPSPELTKLLPQWVEKYGPQPVDSLPTFDDKYFGEPLSDEFFTP